MLLPPQWSEMASVMVNNPGTSPPEGFLDPSQSSSYGWISPRISFSHDFCDDGKPPASPPPAPRSAEKLDLDFEFRRVDNPAAMLPADELFSDGKLLPRRLAPPRPPPSPPTVAAARLPAPEKTPVPDPYAAFSPKAPTCTSRWRELLRLRRAAEGAAARSEARRSSSRCSSSSSSSSSPAAANTSGSATRSLKQFLHMNPSPSPPTASYSAPIPSRRTVSLGAANASDVSISLDVAPARVHLVPRARRPPARRATGAGPARRSASVESPRVNSSGRVVFHGLGRSSSSPSALHVGGARGRHAAGRAVCVAPVLNVAVCSHRSSSGRSSSSPGSMFGLGQLFSGATKTNGGGGGVPGTGKIERA